MIAEPSSSRQTFAAESCWPLSGRALCTAARKLVREPWSDSSESAHARSAVFASRRARTRPSEAMDVMNCVPFTSESPSLLPSRTGSRPTARSASDPSTSSPSTVACPSPMSGSARCASGARSPLAPTDPRAGTKGRTPRFRHSTSCSTVEMRAPENPLARVFARSSIAARTTSSGYGSPTPQAWLRRSRSWSSSASSSGICAETNRPNPVLTPYVCSPWTPSTRVRAASIRPFADSASLTGRRSTATSHTSPSVRSSPVRTIGWITPRV
jgi:hypothetical protein